MNDNRLTRRQTIALMASGAGAVLMRGSLLPPVIAAGVQESKDFGALQSAVKGTVVAKGSASFDSARDALVWNRRVASLRSPEAIVRVASSQDVVAAIKFARAKGLSVAIRSGGHNYNGTALQNDSLTLDLSSLKAVTIDSRTRKATVGPAVKGGDFAIALAQHDLAFPVGHCSDVGLGGYLLSGGFGWNFGEWGPACMSVTGIEAVTATGDLIYADEKHNSDLLWAARGAGACFFAVVTRFDVVLHPARPAIQAYSVNFSFESAPIVGKWLTETLPHVDPTVEVVCTLGPMDVSGPPVVGFSAFAFGASQNQAAGKLSALQSLPAGAKIIGQPVVQSVTYAELLAGTDAGFPNGKRMAGEPIWSETKVDRLLSAVQGFAPKAPPAPSAIVIVSLGGAVKRPDLRPSPRRAVLSKGGGAFVGAYAFWDDPARDPESITWVRSVVDACEPYTTGRYIGEVDLSRGASRVRECFAPESWQRLLALKKKYDPTNLFVSQLSGA